MIRTAFLLALSLAVCACHSQGGAGGTAVPGDPGDHRPYGEIAPGEVLHLVGTEPFWGGTLDGATLTYTTPGNEQGDTIAVERFGGRGGIGVSGTHDGKPLDMTVTPGSCSDGMSDRTFPFTVTLKIAGETRKGCAWSDVHGFEGPRQP